MNRRGFVAGALAGAALLRSGLGQSGAPVRFAVVGLGTIADVFLRACALSPQVKVTALVTGEPGGKGQRIAQQYGVAASSVYSYADFEKLGANKEVDAVYVALPNSMHCEYTLRAAKLGKHVLCEKPMAISSAECRTMIAACKAAGVKLMVGYRVQFDPTWREVWGRVRDGAIGQVQSFQGGFFNQQPAGAWRLNRKLGGGGSLLDLGIYPLNAIRHTLGEEPVAFTAVTSTTDKSGRFSEVEQSLEWTMKFPSGVIASCGSSYGQHGSGFLTINGTAGALDLKPAFNYDGVRVVGEAHGQRVELAGTGKVPFQFTLEAEHFADCVRTGAEPLCGGEEGLKDMLAMEAIYRAAGAPIA